MKKIYIHILALILFIGVSISGFGQINRELRKFEISEYLVLDKWLFISKGIKPPCDCEGEDVPNFTFDTHSISNAIYLDGLLQRARDKRLNEWFNKQNDILEKEIEKQLGKSFPNFTEAQKGLYKSREKTNVLNSVGNVIRDYRSKVGVKIKVRDRCLRNLKLLDFRANEINSGIINNSVYGHLKFNSMPLSQITSISQINTLKASEIKEFTNNQWQLDQELKAKGVLEGISSNAFTDNHDLLNELYNKQLVHYNNQGDGWNKLNLMQLYVNDVNVSILIVKDIRIQYYGFGNYVEDYARRKSLANLSIFHQDYWQRLVPIYYQQGLPWAYASSAAQAQMLNLRKQFINNALSALSIDDLLKETAIAGLGSRNENFINAKPTFKAEVENYFKVNDFSKVSSDCVNYLLNQYHNGDDFAANTNLYKSANTPLYQNGQNPNRALQWTPDTQAVNEGFTNFGNVLSALFENYPKPTYEGFIIRDMFKINGLNVNASIQNEWLGSGFYFKKNNGASVAIEFENNNGTSILNYGISANTYLTNLITNLDGALNLVNEIKRYLFVNPAIAGEYKKFLDDNGTSTNSKALLNELSKIIYEDCYGSPIPTYSTAGIRLYAYYKIEQARLKESHPDWSDSKVRNTVLLDMFQTGLDVIGLIPGIGEIADLTNGVIYLVNGDNVNAGLSFAATIPFVGWGATGAKLAIKVTTVAGKTTKIALPFVFKAGGKIDFGSRGLLRQVLDITDKAFEAHHIIPWTKFVDHPIVQAAASAKVPFHMNSKINGIPLKKYIKGAQEGLHGNHPKYDDFVQFRFNKFLEGKGGILDPEDAKKFLETKLIPELEVWIKKAEGYNGSLNDYFKFIVNPMFF